MWDQITRINKEVVHKVVNIYVPKFHNQGTNEMFGVKLYVKLKYLEEKIETDN